MTAVDRIQSHLEQHEKELEALCQIAAILGNPSRQQEMLMDVLDVLERELDMRRSTIMLLSPDEKELVIEAARNIQSPDQWKVRYRRGEGIIGRVLATGESAIVPRISQEQEFKDRIFQRKYHLSEEHSFICVPIVMGREVIGTLSVDFPYEEPDFLEEDKRMLSIVASMIAYDVKARRTVQAERQALEEENLRLRNALEEKHRPENIVGNSKGMREVYQKIHQVSTSDTTVLIRGESGTGKELVASAIHYSSPRAKKPFIKVNCAALNDQLIESELFGHEKGSFTGAMNTRIGRLEEAEGGTLFLDEIGDFSLPTQVRLLRVLQEREFQRVGSNRTIIANVRIIAATNKNLEEALENRLFRQDLFYRINVFPLFLPPLRDRKDDILLLADYFVGIYSAKMNKTIRRISTTAINMMAAYHWPGNVRELENCIEHAVLLSDDGVIHGYSLPPTLQMPDLPDVKRHSTFLQRVELLERELLIDALKQTNGNMTATAKDLGITPRMVRYKINKLGIDVPSISKHK